MGASVWAICCMPVDGGRYRGGFSAIAGLSLACPQAAPLTVVQHSVGHGLRTGTDNLPILNHVLNPPQQVGHGPQQHDYSNLNTPSVWRTPGAAGTRRQTARRPLREGGRALRGCGLLCGGLAHEGGRLWNQDRGIEAREMLHFELYTKMAADAAKRAPKTKNGKAS